MSSIQPQNRLVILGIVFYLLAMPLIIFRLKPYSTYETYTQVTLLFSAYVVLFAVLEGYSTYMQVVQNERRFKIEDARNELEKVFGPLYVMFSDKYSVKLDEESANMEPVGYYLNGMLKSDLNNIFARFPHMIPIGLFDYWRDVIQDLDNNAIPYDFVERIHVEYKRRINEYNKLLNKN